MQIDCTSWLAGVDHDGEGMMCVITRMVDMHARTGLGNEEALKLLQRLGYAASLAVLISVLMAVSACPRDQIFVACKSSSAALDRLK